MLMKGGNAAELVQFLQKLIFVPGTCATCSNWSNAAAKFDRLIWASSWLYSCHYMNMITCMLLGIFKGYYQILVECWWLQISASVYKVIIHCSTIAKRAESLESFV